MVQEPEWDDGDWRCVVELPAWNAYLDDSGLVETRILVEDPERSEIDKPLSEIRWLQDHQELVLTAIESQMLAFYSKNRSMYEAHLEDPDMEMPEHPSPDQFRNLCKLTGIFVHEPDARGRCCIGFSFRASWDVEHGVGAVVRRNIVLGIGEAHVAFCGIE